MNVENLSVSVSATISVCGSGYLRKRHWLQGRIQELVSGGGGGLGCRFNSKRHTAAKQKLDFQVENQPHAAYIGRTALVCVEECVHSIMFLKKQLQA